jgi:hypothetical protein
MNSTDPIPPDVSDKAKIRDDFIRRLFAVAISVGFAATFVDMDWVKNATSPNQKEGEQLVILLTGMIATVLSYEGYLLSIKRKPLYGYWRFAIDIFLVFIYMFFLISSKQPKLWLPILAGIFSLYVIWDFLTVKEHLKEYDESIVRDRAKASDVLRIYVGGLLDKTNVNRGPIITLSWTIYFWILAIMNQWTAKWQVFVTCTFAILGLWLYRRDKEIKVCCANVAGYPMLRRALIIMVLLSLALLYFSVFQEATPS